MDELPLVHVLDAVNELHKNHAGSLEGKDAATHRQQIIEGGTQHRHSEKIIGLIGNQPTINELRKSLARQILRDRSFVLSHDVHLCFGLDLHGNLLVRLVVMPQVNLSKRSLADLLEYREPFVQSEIFL